MEEQVQLLIKENFSCHSDEVYKLIQNQEEIATGSIKEVARYISNNEELLEMFIININDDEMNLSEGWHYANEQEVVGCIRLAKLYTGYEYIH